MSKHPHRLILPPLSFFALLLSIAFLTAQPPSVAGQSSSTIHLIAIDAIPEGNTATSLGKLDPCVRTEVGSEATVDLVVDAIPPDRPMIAFDMHILYDPQIVEAVATNNALLLAANGSFDPFEAIPALSDSLPDSDGELRISILDLDSNIAGQLNEETGPGVLSRITFRAKAAGTTELRLGFDPGNVYPGIIDLQNSVIEVEQTGSAVLAVGQDCPSGLVEIPTTNLPPIESFVGTPQASPSPSPGGTPGGTAAAATRTPAVPTGTATNTASGSDNGGGSDGLLIVLIVVLVALGLAAAAGGAWALYRRRRAPP